MTTKEDLQIVMKASEILKKEDFFIAFKKVLEIILKMEQKNSQTIDDLKQMYANLYQVIQNKYDINLVDLKKQVDDFLNKVMNSMKAEHRQQMVLLDQKITLLENKFEKENKESKEGKEGKEGKSGRDGKDFSPELYQKVLNDIESIKKDIQKTYEEARRPKAIGGMKKIVSYQSVDLSASVDGTTKSFTLPRKTIQVIDVRSSQFPFVYRKTIDWTLTGNTLTLTSAVTAPQSTQTLIALIEVGYFGKTT